MHHEMFQWNEESLLGPCAFLAAIVDHGIANKARHIFTWPRCILRALCAAKEDALRCSEVWVFPADRKLMLQSHANRKRCGKLPTDSLDLRCAHLHTPGLQHCPLGLQHNLFRGAEVDQGIGIFRACVVMQQNSAKHIPVGKHGSTSLSATTVYVRGFLTGMPNLTGLTSRLSIATTWPPSIFSKKSRPGQRGTHSLNMR